MVVWLTVELPTVIAAVPEAFPKVMVLAVVLKFTEPLAEILAKAAVPVNVGETANAFAPVPVTEPKSVKPPSQAAAVFTVASTQVICPVVWGIMVNTNAPLLEFTVKLPVELFAI